jgi:hypothetical protein
MSVVKITCDFFKEDRYNRIDWANIKHIGEHIGWASAPSTEPSHEFICQIRSRDKATGSRDSEQVQQTRN